MTQIHLSDRISSHTSIQMQTKQLESANARFAYSMTAYFFQAEDGIRDWSVTGAQTCALPISRIRGHKIELQGLTNLVSDFSIEIGKVSDLKPVTEQALFMACACDDIAQIPYITRYWSTHTV